jgi:hypothetical protein
MKRKEIEVLDGFNMLNEAMALGFDAHSADFVLANKFGKAVARHWSAKQLSDWALERGATRVSWSGRAFEEEDRRRG